MSEAYTLSDKVGLEADTAVGALRGLDSFSALVSFANGTFWVPAEYSVIDAPRFEHRGLLIDSARHYLSVDAILLVLEGMSFCKLNVLHWHLVDAESFALVIDSLKNLSLYGAFQPSDIYTKDDVRRVVEYGYARGIRIIPEIDNPGHSGGMGKGYPEAVALCPPGLNENVENIPLDPSYGFSLISGILDHVKSIFPDAMIHLGGDEVVLSCWSGNPRVASWLQQMGFSTLEALSYWM
jgi:hexosaminidase